ncbi:hypothetical protein H920_18863 [Fukomys damarensis]|uniref:Uncharacterized protein n=1 Tax=Fukomys damarensis TaxID=885580 RepID=A0A091CR10_FUKDA|nr:hypothetical protein H920_18863 [Fukomys damarensis]
MNTDLNPYWLAKAMGGISTSRHLELSKEVGVQNYKDGQGGEGEVRVETGDHRHLRAIPQNSLLETGFKLISQKLCLSKKNHEQELSPRSLSQNTGYHQGACTIHIQGSHLGWDLVMLESSPGGPARPGSHMRLPHKFSHHCPLRPTACVRR